MSLSTPEISTQSVPVKNDDRAVSFSVMFIAFGIGIVVGMMGTAILYLTIDQFLCSTIDQQQTIHSLAEKNQALRTELGIYRRAMNIAQDKINAEQAHANTKGH